MNDLNVYENSQGYTFIFVWGNEQNKRTGVNYTNVAISKKAKIYLQFNRVSHGSEIVTISLIAKEPDNEQSVSLGYTQVTLSSVIPVSSAVRECFSIWNTINDVFTFFEEAQYVLPNNWRDPNTEINIKTDEISIENLVASGMNLIPVPQKVGEELYFTTQEMEDLTKEYEQIVSLFILKFISETGYELDNTIVFPNAYPWSITKNITSSIKVNFSSSFTDITNIRLILYVNGKQTSIFYPTSNPQTFFIPYSGKIQLLEWPELAGNRLSPTTGEYFISPQPLEEADSYIVFRPKMIHFFDLPVEKDGEDVPVFDTLVDRMTYLTDYIVASKIYGEDEAPPALPVFYGNQGTFVFTADQDNIIPVIKRANYMYVFNGYEEMFFWINSAEKLEKPDSTMPDTYELSIEKDIFATELQYAINFYNSAQANDYSLNLPKFRTFKPEQASAAVFNESGSFKIYTEAQVNYSNIIDCQGVKGNATRTGALKSQGTDIVSPNDFVFVASFLTLDEGQNFSDIIWVASEQHALTDTEYGAAKNDLNAFRLASQIILRDVGTGTQKTYTCTPLHIYLIPSYWIAEDYNTQVFVKTPYSGNDSGNIMWKVNYIASRTGQGAVTVDEIQVNPLRTTWFGSLYSKKELKYRDEPYHYSVYVNTTLTPGELYVYVNFEGELIDYSADFEMGLFYSEEAQYAAQNGQTAKLNVLAGTIGTAASLFSGPIGIFGAAQSAVNTLNSWLSYQEKFKSMASVKIVGQGFLNASFAAGFSVWEYGAANDETVNETIDLYGYDVSGKITGIDFAPAFSTSAYEHFYMKGDAEGIEGTSESCKQWLKNKIKGGVRFWTQPDKM